MSEKKKLSKASRRQQKQANYHIIPLEIPHINIEPNTIFAFKRVIEKGDIDHEAKIEWTFGELLESKCARLDARELEKRNSEQPTANVSPFFKSI